MGKDGGSEQEFANPKAPGQIVRAAGFKIPTIHSRPTATGNTISMTPRAVTASATGTVPMTPRATAAGYYKETSIPRISKSEARERTTKTLEMVMSLQASIKTGSDKIAYKSRMAENVCALLGIGPVLSKPFTDGHKWKNELYTYGTTKSPYPRPSVSKSQFNLYCHLGESDELLKVITDAVRRVSKKKESIPPNDRIIDEDIFADAGDYVFRRKSDGSKNVDDRAPNLIRFKELSFRDTDTAALLPSVASLQSRNVELSLSRPLGVDEQDEIVEYFASGSVQDYEIEDDQEDDDQIAGGITSKRQAKHKEAQKMANQLRKVAKLMERKENKEKDSPS